MKVSLLKAVAFTVLQAVHGSTHEAVSTKDIQSVAVGAAEYVTAERRRGDWWYDARNYNDCMNICDRETSWSVDKCDDKCLDVTGDIARGRNKIRRNSGRRRRRRSRNFDDDRRGNDDDWKDDDRRRDFDDDGCGPGRAFKKSSSNRSGCKPSASTKRAVKRNRNRRRRCNGRYCDSSVSEDEREEDFDGIETATAATKASKEDRSAEREANRSSKATKSPSAFDETETAIA